MNKNIIIFSPLAVFQTHFETDLEIAQKHLDDGDNVTFVYCDGELKEGCIAYYQNSANCILCKSRRKVGYNLLKVGSFQKVEISVKGKNEVKIPEGITNSFEQLKNFEIDGLKVGAFVLSTLITVENEPEPILENFQEYLSDGINKYMNIYYNLSDILLKNKADCLYVFNGRFYFCHAALDAGLKNKVETFVHERTGTVQRYTLEKNTIPHDLEHKKQEIQNIWNSSPLSDAEKVMLAEKWYHERRGGGDQAWFSYLKSQKKSVLPDGFDRTKRNVAIYVSSEEEFVSLPGWENPIFKSQNNAIDEITSYFLNNEEFHFYLRIHPNLSGVINSQTKFLKEFKKSNCTVLQADDPVDTYALMENSEKIIVFGSTMGIESNFWKKTTILIGRSRYEDLEGTYNPSSKNELYSLISETLEPKNTLAASMYAFWELNYGVPFLHYKPSGAFDGKFKNVKIKPTFFALNRFRTVAVVQKILRAIL